MSIIDRIGALAGTELGKAIDLAHRHYQERMGAHNHTGRALVETAAEVARNHPNLIGIGVGLLVEQYLAHQKRQHDLMIASGGRPLKRDHDRAPKTDQHAGDHSGGGLHLPHLHVPVIPHDLAQVAALRPGRVALEVFGGILLLKLASTGARMFRHRHQGEVWFAPAARVRLFSGTLAAYYLMKSIRSPKLSAWRNAAVALFATDAMKPVLKVRKGDRPWVNTEPPHAELPDAPFPASAPPRPPGPYTRPTFPSEAAASAGGEEMAKDHLNGAAPPPTEP
jgi:hypothetical protein